MMTYLNIFLFFFGLVPVNSDIETKQTTELKPAYQTIEAVKTASNNDDAEVAQCDDWPFCYGE